MPHTEQTVICTGLGPTFGVNSKIWSLFGRHSLQTCKLMVRDVPPFQCDPSLGGPAIGPILNFGPDCHLWPLSAIQ